MVADLVEVQSIAKQNKGFRYILVIIDEFSKYAWAQPIKKKTGKDVTEAFVKILKSANGHKPQNLQTDAGKKFYNQVFQNLMKQQNIYHFLHLGVPKPVLWNDSIEPSNQNCTNILQQLTC